MSIQLTIIGLGQIGTSIGLALRPQANQITRVGSDTSMENARKAEKLGAIDRSVYNLHKAVEKADIVILAAPVDEIRQTLEQIAPDLRSGTVVLDTSPVKRTITDWAVELLPQERYFISFTPSLNPLYLEDTALGIDAAHADLFQNSIISITSPPGTDPDAIKLAADLAALLGARPLFIDPLESDSLVAAVVQLPKLIAAALLNATINEPGWMEGRKVAGRDYAMITNAILNLDEAEKLGESAIQNRDNLVRVIDNLITALDNLRDAIDEQDQQKLQSLLEHALKGRAVWLEDRRKANWDTFSKDSLGMPTPGDMIGRLFFGWRGKDRQKR